jgi:hypothetical protein
MRADEGYPEHLVFGISWLEERGELSRAVLEALGAAPHPVKRGGDADVYDELAILELGPHVECELVLQEYAASGHIWDDLGQYLEGLIEYAEEVEATW